jgi:regulator of sirC expression with transglutaminase-like and TPR domain
MDSRAVDWAESVLRDVAATRSDRLDLGEAALALASLERRQVGLARYRDHLAQLAEDVAACAGQGAPSLAGRAAALNETILGKHGYRGDADTYDDLQNANLMRVIDRRRGLPVTLGILYMHAARAQGWDMVGLAFPGHFLVRLEAPDGCAIVDPFNQGKLADASALRELLHGTAGADAELAPEHYAPVPDRAVLLRLQNNIKLRLIGADRIAEAARVIEIMLLFAPDHSELWREAGLLHAHLGNLGAATAAIERFLEIDDDHTARHTMAALLQRMRAKLN